MINTEMVDGNEKQNNEAMYGKYYESCQEKSDRLNLTSDRGSLLHGEHNLGTGSACPLAESAGQGFCMGACFADFQ